METINKKYELLKVLKKKTNNKITFLSKRVGESKYLIIKKYNCNIKSSYLSFEAEKNIDFLHPNINKLEDAFVFENSGFIVREFVQGIDSWVFANSKYNRKKIFSEKILIKLAIQLLEGIDLLHKNEIIHRDIRPQNILFEIKNYKHKIEKAVLSDFELIKFSENKNIDSFTPFSFIFSPPEQVLRFNNLVNQNSDLYSLAISLWCILSKKYPFYHKIPEVLANLQISLPLPHTRNISKNLLEIIQKATIKPVFKTHPRNMSRDNLIDLLENAKNQRYRNASEMKKDLISIF